MSYTRHPVQPETTDIRIVDGVYVKATTFRAAGMIVPQHAHSHPHLSYIAAGAVLVFADGQPLGRFDAPAAVSIEAGVKHLFRILQPGTVILCIHNADRLEADGEPPIAGEHHIVEG